MKAHTSVEINPILAGRRSPRSLEEGKVLSREDLLGLLEAARWAPSAFNAQPWRYFVGNHGDELFEKILASLSPFNQEWAKRASALIFVAGVHSREGKPHPSFQYDCGLSVAQLVLEAHHRGLVAHQMTGVNFDALATSISLSQTLTPVVVIAVGHQADPSQLNEVMQQRELAPRERAPLSEIVVTGLPA